MVELIIVGEGQTEETFVRDVLAHTLAANDVFATPRVIQTSPGHRGGALNLGRVRRFIRNTLRERDNTYLTTLFDLYALDESFPGVADTRGQPPAARAQHIEQLLREDIVAFAGCRPDRFVPHVQPHEFESLLFADVDQRCEVEPEWNVHRETLANVRAGVQDPEWINDSPQTAPSRRLEVLRPRYRKVRHGPVGAARIGLDRIREQCPHFRQWFDRMVTLSPL
jgi:hypothetical protein